jgi:hypothetical protein
MQYVEKRTAGSWLAAIGLRLSDWMGFGSWDLGVWEILFDGRSCPWPEGTGRPVLVVFIADEFQQVADAGARVGTQQPRPERQVHRMRKRTGVIQGCLVDQCAVIRPRVTLDDVELLGVRRSAANERKALDYAGSPSLTTLTLSGTVTSRCSFNGT